ncbi:ribonuclease III [Clostridiales bacterium PH28_bin88]|nr:ribonuclease III [Clostridiales bacterium PH28_bin88]
MDASRRRELQELLVKLDIRLNLVELVNVALTHPTFAFEHKHLKWEHNQRMEFLGDAVIGLVVAEYLYHMFPGSPEGDLTKMRAAIVCEPTLAQRARQLELGSYILLGRGEELTGGRDRSSVLADVFEAVVGAIFLEGGLETARDFVVRELGKELKSLVPGEYRDYKTLLQELVQKRFDSNVNYAILRESGPDHDKRFVAGVSLQNRLLAKGTGRSKKEAEQQAAQHALELLMGEEV